MNNAPSGVRFVLVGASLMVSVAALVDIRDALQLRRLLDSMDAMERTITDMEQFNITLRAQRHDFLNHLQVVYSLMEMGESEEAAAYLEKVYGSIRSVSRVMKTAHASVNALLQAKLTACEAAGIRLNLNITSSWKDMDIPGWEMCKVLANLIDNAMDAMEDSAEKLLDIDLTEDLHCCRFRISNTGPMIPAELRGSIFEAGVTTKAEGHGMGLFIVKSTLQNYGGDIALMDMEGRTCFEGWVPRKPAVTAKEEI